MSLRRSSNFVRNRRLRATGRNLVLDGSLQSPLRLVRGTHSHTQSYTGSNVTITKFRVNCSAGCRPKSLITNCTSRPTPVPSYMPVVSNLIETISNVFGKIRVLPATYVAPEMTSRGCIGNVCVIQDLSEPVDSRFSTTGGIADSIRYTKLDSCQNVELNNSIASPQVRYFLPMMQGNNATCHNWSGLLNLSARPATSTITRPTFETLTNFGIGRFYHSHSDGVEFELHPNTFSSSEKTRKFVKKLRKKQRALLLNELQTLDQELNRDVTQEDQHMLLPPSREQLRLVMLNNAVPFIGFGFLDNAIMIIAGDYIDWRIGALFGISTLAAAGLGNLVSDLAGVVLAGYVESFAAKFGIPPPNLSLEQYDMRGPKIASAVGRCVGIALGCLLGMFPLLFLKTDSEDKTGSIEEDTKE